SGDSSPHLRPVEEKRCARGVVQDDTDPPLRGKRGGRIRSRPKLWNDASLHRGGGDSGWRLRPSVGPRPRQLTGVMATASPKAPRLSACLPSFSAVRLAIAVAGVGPCTSRILAREISA